MEKQITISNLRAVYTKDFDTFGKMDPFLVFSIGKAESKTETAHSAGKEPSWTTTIVLAFFEEPTIIIKSYEEDKVTNDYMGEGKIQVKSLKASGDIEFKIFQENGTCTGTVYGKYVLKTLPPVPILNVRNIKCDFYKDTQFILKTKPFVSITCNNNTAATVHKDQGDSRLISWNEALKLKIKDGEKITFSLEDKNDTSSKIFTYDAYHKQFKTTTGSKKFSVIDKNFEPLGTLEFDYETQNFVNKQQSTKNQEAVKKASNQLTQITINSIKGDLANNASDLYFKVCVGSNSSKTAVLDKAPKDFNMINVDMCLYAERTENKIIFAAYDKEGGMDGDTYKGSGQLLFDNLVQGKNVVQLVNRREKSFGKINVHMSSKKVIYRQLTLTNIKAETIISADLVGPSDMFIVGKIGGWSSQTEVITNKIAEYRKNLNFKFSDQKKLHIQVLDQDDLSKDDLMYSLDLDLEDFKQSGEMTIPLVPQEYKNDKSKHGKLYFKYVTKNNIYKPKVQKKEEPIQPVKKQQPKKQQIKKQQPKKQVPKQEPKKTEPKKEEPKKEQPKKQETKKTEPKKQQPKKQEPKKEEVIKKAETKIQQSQPTKKITEPSQPKAEQKMDPIAERQLVISDLKGSYMKDYDTCGKMDPFLSFNLGKEQIKTEVAQDQGKQPVWKQQIKYKYYEEKLLTVKSFDSDPTRNQQMDEAKIETKTLKPGSGPIEMKLLDQKGQHIGTITGKYTLKALPLVPTLVIKNAKCKFFKDTEFVIKTKPFITATTNGATVATDPKDKGDSRQLAWNEPLRLKLKDGEKITFCLEDKNDTNSKIFTYDAYPKQFKTTSGTKKFNVVDKNFESLGTLELDFESQNFVTKEESAKNEQAAKKASNQLTQITIHSIKGDLAKDASDLFFKICLGPTVSKTKVLDKAPKDFNMTDVDMCIYADKTENKISFAAYDQQTLDNTFKGSGELLIDNLAQGKNTVKLVNKQGQNFGNIIINIYSKTVTNRQVTLKDIKVTIPKSVDFVGESDLYIVGKLAGNTRRTQVQTGKSVTFKQPLTFKYSQEKEIVLDVMDSDKVSKDDIVGKVTVNLEQLKQKGELKVPLIMEDFKDDKDDKNKQGEVVIKYDAVNPVSSDKKAPAPKKQQPVQKKELKKQQIKKQQPKKQEPKKEQPKIQDKKNTQQKKSIINQKKLQELSDNQKSPNEKSNLEKSRRTQIKLPQINDPKNYGDRIYDKQSSATLQKSIHVYSMPKANRFGSGPKYSGEPSYYVDSCFKPSTGKGAGFGFGHKRQFPQWMERNMKQNPAPGSYFDHHSSTAHQFRARGPTFGIPYKYYEKVTIPKQKIEKTVTQRKSPQKIVNHNR